MISVKAELAAKNMKYKEAAKELEVPYVNFCRKLRTNQFTLEEAEKVLKLVGKKIVLVKEN